MFTKTVMIASMPNSAGASRRAITICTTSWIAAEPPCSKSFQKSDLTVVALRSWAT